MTSKMVAALTEHYAPAPDSGSAALPLHVYRGKPADPACAEGELWGDYFYLKGLTRLARPE